MKRRWLFAIGVAAVAAGTFGVIRWRRYVHDNAPGCTRALYANESVACAEQPDGFWCWGSNFHNELGDPKFKDKETPTRVDFPHKGLASISMRYETGTAVDHGHALFWGDDIDNSFGDPQLGHARAVTHPTPVRLRDFPDDLVEIRSGQTFLCAKRRSGQLYCWFDDVGEERGVDFPVILPGPVQQFDVSQGLACAVQGGKVYCWGPEPWASWPPKTQADGKLAITPKPLAGFSGVAKQVSVDGNAYIVRRDGSLWVIGTNNNGEFGNGTHDTCDEHCPQHPLARVDRLGNTVVKVASNVAVCALVRDGSVYCWGSNGNGVAGHGYTNISTDPTEFDPAALVPQRIEGLGKDNVDLVVNYRYACSIKRNRSVWCWGATAYVGSSEDCDRNGCQPSRVPLVCPE